MDKKKFEERKKTIYEFICDPAYVPMRVKDIAALLQVAKDQRDDLKTVLDDLVNEGKIEVNGHGRYKKAVFLAKEGKFEATTRGFGFIIVEGMEEDIYVSPKDKGTAMHGDTVEFELKRNSHGKRREGRITGILSRNTSELVGTFEKAGSFGFVIPDNPRYQSDIFVGKDHINEAETGDKVVVCITDYGDERRNPEGFISEVIGAADEAGTDVLSIIKGFGLPFDFPEKVLDQALSVAKPVSEADMAGRRDLRSLRTVTIDGEDAKDLDDAVTISRTQEGNFLLGVHIADVTNYVQESSALDKEALARGTSVYLVDRVIPMLPKELSNGICSLNQGEDRLTLSCLMTIDPKGAIIDHEICESVINVDARMTYTSVNKIITDEDEAECERYRDFVDDFKLMKELSEILRNRRFKRGAIDFDIPESKIVLEDSGKPIEIKPYDRNAATKLIEDFMLAANETVAEDYFWQEMPFVYRTHDNPDSEKIRSLAIFINNFGYSLKSSQEEVHPKEIQKLLTKIAGTPAEALISRLTLRSLKQARYTTDCSGHFGLAAKYYCHFTSPIRRYPDLQIHRIIKDSLRGRMNERKLRHYNSILPEVAKSSSELERRAEEAERETDKLKKAEYMLKYIGETFEGVISGMNSYGIFVELPNTVEGMVSVASMKDDYYTYNERSFELIGERKNKHYKLGQTVKVQVVGADILRRTVDFELVDN